MNRQPVWFASAIALFAVACHARPIPQWSYNRLFDESDLVVIGTVTTNTDTTDVFKHQENDKGAGYTGVNSAFRTLRVLKGDHIEAFTVLHFRHSSPFVVADGMLVVTFRTSQLSFQGTVQSQDKKTAPASIAFDPGLPQYLLFLKRRPDGRYAPTTGQYDAALSFREMYEPMTFPQREQE